MANPNIVDVTSILGESALLLPANTTANILLQNTASSGKVYKINQIVAANVDGASAVNTTVSITDEDAGAGDVFPIVSTVSVPADASLIVVDKTTAIYLMEDKSIIVTSGTASKISYTISYEVISS
jgi:DNA-binding PucR family transcriptional regulator